MPALAALTDADAVRLFKEALKTPGTLQIITDERAAGVPESAAHPRFAANPLADPALWVCHAVTRVEGPDENGRMVAYSDEGDWCQGRPAALFRRLREAGVAAALAAAEEA